MALLALLSAAALGHAAPMVAAQSTSVPTRGVKHDYAPASVTGHVSVRLLQAVTIDFTRPSAHLPVPRRSRLNTAGGQKIDASLFEFQ